MSSFIDFTNAPKVWEEGQIPCFSKGCNKLATRASEKAPDDPDYGDFEYWCDDHAPEYTLPVVNGEIDWR